jgi:hypothetical protein
MEDEVVYTLLAIAIVHLLAPAAYYYLVATLDDIK